MNLDVHKLEDKGNLDRERIVLRAKADLEVGKYVILKCVSTADGKVLASDLPAAFWFPDKKIKTGDFVVLYSKTGTRSEKKGDDGNMTYFYYWGVSEAQWNQKFTPVLIEANTWTFVV